MHVVMLMARCLGRLHGPRSGMIHETARHARMFCFYVGIELSLQLSQSVLVSREVVHRHEPAGL